MMLGLSGLTPCGALFDTLKREGGISHRELAGIVLSSRPLVNGRSPVSLANDRAWLSRFVVRAPVVSLQDRYFADYATAAARLGSRLRSRRGRSLSSDQILAMICGDTGRSMDRALEEAGQDPQLYRNALDRIIRIEGRGVSERADAALVLFVAAGCSGNARRAVSYTLDFLEVEWGRGGATTPAATIAGDATGGAAVETQTLHPLGLMREKDGYVAGDVHWIDPMGSGAILGALALGESDITDVEPDVSAEHARISFSEGRWLVEDLASTNGTVLIRAGSEAVQLQAHEPAEIAPGDELRLGAETTFVVVMGAADIWGA